ncbi:MAG TPA: glycosyltransferase family A protein [Puia sp.]|nr:glycosyltransferase family A protein [Puia sp.]
MKLAPIALFTYNRLVHTRRTVEALEKNELATASDLFIFSDGAKAGDDKKNVDEVREYLLGIKGFKSVTLIEREMNLGLAENIISGVSQIIGEFGNIIVLEDDLITSAYFVRYMNDALSLYENEEGVASIHGYVYPVKERLQETFFIRGADCFGWATWKRGWDIFIADGKMLLDQLQQTGQTHAFDFDGAYPYTKMLKDQTEGRNDSWAVRWYASAFLRNKFTLYPGTSLVHHIGGDGSGTHSGFGDILDVVLSESRIIVSRIEVKEDEQARLAFVKFLPKVTRPKILYRIRRKIKKLFSA